jgi:hypothetical protein
LDDTTTGGGAEGEAKDSGSGGSTKGIQVTRFLEKPSAKKAQEELKMSGLKSDNHYLTIFGLYVISKFVLIVFCLLLLL